MTPSLIPLLASLAAILLGALIGGRLASICRIPRVTGYLITGLLIGPSFAHLTGLPVLLPPIVLQEFRIVSDIALALILMHIGGLFEFGNLDRWRNRILLFSGSEIVFTFLFVSLATFVVNQFVLHQVLPGMSLRETSLAFGLFLGIIAVATAPAATLMVIREYEAEGPITSLVLTLVGFNNLASVLGFAVLAHIFIAPGESLTILFWRMIGPMVIGAGVGFALAVWAQRLELPSENKILMIGGVAATTAICRSLEIDYLLASLVLGMTLANSCPRWPRLQEHLRQVDYLLYVAFFVLAGANLHIETLGHIGLLGVAYVLARTLGKWLGAKMGARLGAFGTREMAYVGLTLMAQAGVAIGLAGQLAQNWPLGGKLLETVVLGAVVVFELIGPLAVRHGLVRSGEVPILAMLQKRAPVGALEGMHNVVQQFRTSLHIPVGHNLNDPGDILVRHIMRQNVETVRHDTPYYDLLKHIAHSRYDRFPVVDDQGHFVGMINYTEIRDLLFEPALVPLVVAGDLAATEQNTLFPDQPLREALQIIQQHQDMSFFAVVEADDQQKLVGILSQNDVLAAFRRLGHSAG
ncbi:MAG: cation:proton antiporter [Deltaproteobacteria bacterium]|jgi:Kef-type K+ transport system membrane component KefB/predicted transcriptional regulator|nr:cation:proton antiporter [Deltaproteobacteria bacterium]MBW2520694.1 cation:proton antiporter [Deltaproteobacteria bacterium]